METIRNEVFEYLNKHKDNVSFYKFLREHSSFQNLNNIEMIYFLFLEDITINQINFESIIDKVLVESTITAQDEELELKKCRENIAITTDSCEEWSGGILRDMITNADQDVEIINKVNSEKINYVSQDTECRVDDECLEDDDIDLGLDNPAKELEIIEDLMSLGDMSLGLGEINLNQAEKNPELVNIPMWVMRVPFKNNRTAEILLMENDKKYLDIFSEDEFPHPVYWLYPEIHPVFNLTFLNKLTQEYQPIKEIINIDEYENSHNQILEEQLLKGMLKLLNTES